MSNKRRKVIEGRRPAYEKYAGKLWAQTESDWHVYISHTLTEPVCCYVTLYSDDPNLPRLDNFIGIGDVNESIANACKHILKLLKKS